MFVSDSRGEYQAVFEDDGRVAYVYLLLKNQIIGDVWVYNRAEASVTPEWQNRDNEPPYLNPAMFTFAEPPFPLPESEQDISLDWMDDAENAGVEVCIRGALAARLVEGKNPGYSRSAAADGPLAFRLI